MKCKCTKEYIFNKTDIFSGVIFKKDNIYDVDITHYNEPYNLVSVSNSDNGNCSAIVGMSVDTFNQHFIFMEERNESSY